MQSNLIKHFSSDDLDITFLFSSIAQQLCTIMLCVPRDESVCIYTNAAFLAVADSKRFVMFNVKTGDFYGIMNIPCHLERTKGWLFG